MEKFNDQKPASYALLTCLYLVVLNNRTEDY